MTAAEVETLVKASLDAGLKVSVVANEDGSSTVKVTTSFTVGAAATAAEIQAAFKKYLNVAQAAFHNLVCQF